MNLPPIIAVSFDESLVVLCIAGGFTAIFFGYVVVREIRRSIRHRRRTRRAEQR